MSVIRYLDAFRKSLFAQILAVSLGGVSGFLMIVAVLFQTTVIFRIFPSSLSEAAQPFHDVVLLIENVPTNAERNALSAINGSGLVVVIRDDFQPDSLEQPQLMRRFESGNVEVSTFLSERNVRFRYISRFGVLSSKLEQLPYESKTVTAIEISTRLNDGRIISVIFPPLFFLFGGSLGPLVFLSFIALIISILSIVLIKHALQPLQRLERATQNFDGVSGLMMVEESGAEEIRRVARALNLSQRRLRKLMDERSRMVSAIAHDVRTAITKLRLRLDRPDDIVRTEVEQDLAQMQRLIEDMLTYAKSNQTQSHLELVNLSDFAKDYVNDAPTEIAADIVGEDEPFVIAADRLALTRVLNNLVDNATRYGGDVTLTYGLVKDEFEIRICDNGPGIPEEDLENVFEPFFRLETSRNRDTGGSGLGLGIARALLEAQGGALTLRNRPSGGLSAIMRFPEPCKVN